MFGEHRHRLFKNGEKSRLFVNFIHKKADLFEKYTQIFAKFDRVTNLKAFQ